MDFTRQSVRAQNMHSTYLANKEKTCIDCHKGIAHRLPYIPPGEAPTDTPGQVVPTGDARGLVPTTGSVRATPLADGCVRRGYSNQSMGMMENISMPIRWYRVVPG